MDDFEPKEIDEKAEEAWEARMRGPGIPAPPELPPTAEEKQAQGDELIHEGRLTKAIKAYRDAVNLDRDNAAYRVRLGDAYAYGESATKAIAEYRKVLKMNPRRAEPHFSLAEIYRRHGKMQAAINSYRKAVQYNPMNPFYRYKLGHALGQTGSFDEAVEQMEAAVHMTVTDGFYHFCLGDLYALLDGARETVPFEPFGLSDGIYSDEFNGGYQASALKGSDGRLWFPTTAGVVMVDPAKMPTNRVPPAVVIERVKVNNIEGVAASGITYPPGAGDLEFHFMGLSFTAPERVRYRYLLEGFNRQWIEAGDRRDAFYTNIPPGTYRFRVQAANSNGVWNEAGTAIAFTLRPHYYQTVWFAIAIGLALAGAIALGLFMYKRYRDREVRASQLESELAHAQVQILEMQLQPHFLFNTLNSIMVLIRQQPDLASRMVARLSEFLRLTLDSAGMQEVPLRRELEFLDRYLHIERIRFGDRLQFEQHVDPYLLDALVPNLILQPLVENAIRHGVSKRRGPALITVSAERSNGSLTIHVRDNGAGLSSRTGGVINEGIGLKNTRQRLQHLYGNEFAFSLESPPEGGVDVVLTLPFHNPST